MSEKAPQATFSNELQPAAFGELFDFLEQQRGFVAGAGVLVAAAHFRERRIALFRLGYQCRRCHSGPSSFRNGSPTGRLTRIPYGRSCSIGGRRRLCDWLIPMAARSLGQPDATPRKSAFTLSTCVMKNPCGAPS